MKLILDHDFATAVPAVDLSPFHHHGRPVDVSHHADGRAIGSGAFGFHDPDAAVRIAASPVWQSPGALAVEAWIRLGGAPRRRNIVEGDGSFALFVAADQTLEGSVRALVDGSTSPGWHVVSSQTHNPAGVAEAVPLNRWCKVVFHHDGITRARLFIDDRLVGSRSDYRSGVSSVGSAGVVIGNWTLSSQYAFDGHIDRVRVWKRDPAALVNRFSSRPVTPEAADAWDALWECLRSGLNEDQRHHFRRLAHETTEVMRDLFRVVQSAPPSDQVVFRDLVRRYRDAWRSGAVDGTDAITAIVDLLSWLRNTMPANWTAALEAVSNDMISLLRASRCVDADALASLDPAYATFIRDAAAKVSGTGVR